MCVCVYYICVSVSVLVSTYLFFVNLSLDGTTESERCSLDMYGELVLELRTCLVNLLYNGKDYYVGLFLLQRRLIQETSGTNYIYKPHYMGFSHNLT